MLRRLAVLLGDALCVVAGADIDMDFYDADAVDFDTDEGAAEEEVRWALC